MPLIYLHRDGEAHIDYDSVFSSVLDLCSLAALFHLHDQKATAGAEGELQPSVFYTRGDRIQREGQKSIWSNTSCASSLLRIMTEVCSFHHSYTSTVRQNLQKSIKHPFRFSYLII